MPKRILYIEDNVQNSRLVRKMLSTVGYEMIEANTGLEGVALAEREMPDLILMDINLPDINGLEATARVKSVPDLAHIPIIALTANAMQGDRERFLTAGCNGYLAKPLAKNDLLNSIARFLSESKPIVERP